jgi:hypothetical protein
VKDEDKIKYVPQKLGGKALREFATTFNQVASYNGIGTINLSDLKYEGRA